LPGRNSSATHELVFLAYKLPPLGVQLNKTTGFIESVCVDDQKLELEQEIAWYAAREPEDKNAWTGLNSAIYMLRTNQTNPFPTQKLEGISVLIYKGSLASDLDLLGVCMFDSIDFQEVL